VAAVTAAGAAAGAAGAAGATPWAKTEVANKPAIKVAINLFICAPLRYLDYPRIIPEDLSN
jgi:hypothetical protein